MITSTRISVFKSTAYYILCIIRWMHRGKCYYRLWKTADFSVEKLWKSFLIAGKLFIRFIHFKAKGRQITGPFRAFKGAYASIASPSLENTLKEFSENI